MKAYNSEGTHKTPTIKFDPVAGTLEIRGRSIPEHPIEFYQPLADALDEYTSSSLAAFVVTIQLEYFNSSSSRCLLSIFKKLEANKKAGANVSINWAYEEGDEEVLAAGEDFQSILRIPVILVPLSK